MSRDVICLNKTNRKWAGIDKFEEKIVDKLSYYDIECVDIYYYCKSGRNNFKVQDILSSKKR